MADLIINENTFEQLKAKYKLNDLNVAEQALEFEMLLRQVKAYEERIRECKKNIGACRENLVSIYSTGTRLIAWRETEPNCGYWVDVETGALVPFTTLEEAKQLYLNFSLEEEE